MANKSKPHVLYYQFILLFFKNTEKGFKGGGIQNVYMKRERNRDRRKCFISLLVHSHRAQSTLKAVSGLNMNHQITSVKQNLKCLKLQNICTGKGIIILKKENYLNTDKHP